ncbi:hypothetical protein [Paenibacillus lutrae]|uniref:Copper amine oxidase-like N-terminal domain-containing protein n=1 Tax=Paenibacillus lutrae TaxID=2078573 RepID=A0A7X3FEB9_9BACL|nr:hypothetical protein [Paenibacillus lutrae]MVO98153.1 hypothetical protein [Paenibacillus lutrae]
MKKMVLFTTLMISMLAFVTSAHAVGSEYTPVPRGEDTITVMISSLGQSKGDLTLQGDRIEWYEGEEADRKFVEHETDIGDMTHAPDGYYIVDDQQKLETFEIDSNAQVLMQLYDRDGTYEGTDIKWNEKVTLGKFLNIYPNNGLLDVSTFPFHLTIKDGKVVKIVQQYIP